MNSLFFFKAKILKILTKFLLLKRKILSSYSTTTTEDTDRRRRKEEGEEEKKGGRRRARRDDRGGEEEDDDRDWFNLLEKIERSFTRGERLDRFFEFDWMCVYSSKRARFGAIDETIESGSIDLHARRGGFWILRLGVIVRYDQVGGVDE
tara:strand:+ start:561 stop:1010 length:450 start_codon:yes stop_codon:yes gene_type:complete